MSDKKWIERYNKATKTWLHECYKKPSTAKQIADAYVRECYENDGGYDFKIISFNTFSFTAGYKMIEDDIEYLKIHTYKRTFKIEL